VAASHKLLSVVGIVASLALAVSIRTSGETLDADDGQKPYTGLWLYTPYVSPGEGIAAKIFLQGGDGVFVQALGATIDGAPVAIEGRRDKARRPSGRFGMGKLEIELRAVVPADLAPGEHKVALNLETTCSGSSYAKACGSVHLAAQVRVGEVFVPRLLAAARAIAAALVVFFGLRFGWDPLKRWVNAEDKSSAGAMAPAFIVLLIVWAYCGYSLFARPIGAALASASDPLYGAAIVTWLAVFPVAVRTRRGAPRAEPREPPTRATVRLLPVQDDEPLADDPAGSGYRAAPERKPPAPPKVSLDEIADALYDEHKARYRRSRNRLVPRWIHGPPVVFEATSGDDAGAGFQMVGDRDFIVIFAANIAERFGRLEITIGKKTVVVDPTETQLVTGALYAKLAD
jgi:hypothetical protein